MTSEQTEHFLAKLREPRKIPTPLLRSLERSEKARALAILALHRATQRGALSQWPEVTTTSQIVRLVKRMVAALNATKAGLSELEQTAREARKTAAR